MSRFIISEAAQNGIQGATKKRIEYDEQYRQIMNEANKRIDMVHLQYVNAYEKASGYMCV